MWKILRDKILATFSKIQFCGIHFAFFIDHYCYLLLYIDFVFIHSTLRFQFNLESIITSKYIN